MIPGVFAPEIVGPQKTALQQVLTQPGRLLGGEVRRADLGHHDERTIEQGGVRQIENEVIRLARRIDADDRLGQLRKPDRQVDVGSRIVHRPAAAVAVAAAGKHHAAEVEGSVEALGRRTADGLEETAASAAELRARRADAEGEQHRRGRRTNQPSAAAHDCIVFAQWSSWLRANQTLQLTC
jgi:hypothetical protein